MQFTLQYPMPHPARPEWLDPASIVQVAQAAEAAGFGAIAFTEHPAPSHKWLVSGGHESFDPFVALAFCAGVTKRIRLMPYLLVVPYHNPFLSAKAAASVDVLSGGRLTLVAGAGYLRSEFLALGVEFDERNELFDEGVEVMKQAWTSNEVAVAGRHFEARGQTVHPRPVQQPHPPIWIGGNSRLARERVARLGQGWSPMQQDERAARTTRTPAMATLEDVRAGIAALRRDLERAGRDPAEVDVQLLGPDGRDIPEGSAVDGHRERVGQLADAGATWFVMNPPHDSVAHALDAIGRYGEDVARPLAGASRPSSV